MAFNQFLLKSLCTDKRKSEIVVRQTILQEYLKGTLETLKAHKRARVFLNKVNKKEAPNYYQIIKNPMDLGTMTRKIHLYRDVNEFQTDLNLIWSNCLVYNAGEYYVDCANEMKIVADSMLLSNNRVNPIEPESFTIDGHQSFDVKPLIKNTIVEYLTRAGFDKCKKQCLSILTDVIGYKIIEEIMKYKSKSGSLQE